MITVRFDANVAPGLPWRFEPEQNEVKVRLGENKLVFFSAENFGDQAIVGHATFNVTPGTAGIFSTRSSISASTRSGWTRAKRSICRSCSLSIRLWRPAETRGTSIRIRFLTRSSAQRTPATRKTCPGSSQAPNPIRCGGSSSSVKHAPPAMGSTRIRQARTSLASLNGRRDRLPDTSTLRHWRNRASAGPLTISIGGLPIRANSLLG